MSPVKYASEIQERISKSEWIRTDFSDSEQNPGHETFSNFTWKYNQWMGASKSRSLPALARNISRMKTRYLNDHNICVTQLELCIVVTFVISLVVRIVISKFSVRTLLPGFFNITKKNILMKYIRKSKSSDSPVPLINKTYKTTLYSLANKTSMSSSHNGWYLKKKKKDVKPFRPRT